MRKLIVPATISCVTFVFSVYTTTAWKWLTGHDKVEAKIERQVFESDGSRIADEEELLDIFRDYGPAQTQHDRGFFERVETTDFMLFSQYGNPLTRSEDIQSMMESPADVTYAVDVLDLKFYGNVAVIKSRMTVIEGDGSREIWPSIDVCVKREGRWKILSTTQFSDGTLDD